MSADEVVTALVAQALQDAALVGEFVQAYARLAHTLAMEVLEVPLEESSLAAWA